MENSPNLFLGEKPETFESMLDILLLVNADICLRFYSNKLLTWYKDLVSIWIWNNS